MPKQIGTEKARVGSDNNPIFVEVPAFVITDHLALINPVVNYEPWTTHYTIVQRTSGLVIGQPFRKYSIVKKLLDDILAVVPADEQAQPNWSNNPTVAEVRKLLAAAHEADKPPAAKKLREKNVTPRLGPDGNYTKRWFALMPFDVPRWIRCYDNGGETFDRYTVVYSGLKNATREHYYRGMSTHPSHPQGFGIFGSTMYKPLDDPFTPGAKQALGKQIVFADLPDECQMVVLSDYCELWHLNPEDHPAFEPELGMFFINPNPEAWHPLRPHKGQHDSRQQQCYWDEKRAMAPESLADLILIAGYEPPLLEEIGKWGWNDRMEVWKWCAAIHFAASDNPVKVPPTPRVMQGVVGDKVMCIPQQQQGD